MELTTIWFILIAVLWTGYFALEGFDFGVGMLLPVLGKSKLSGPEAVADSDKRKRLLLNTIGPHWDGNEVWVLTAGGAIFAAFPHWYATLFAGFYLPLLLILVGLIIRNVGFEYRGKGESDTWRRNWDYCIIVGSFLPALLWGVAFGNIVNGVPLAPQAGNAAPYVEFTGNLFTLLNPLGLLGGLTTLGLFLTHGAMYISLKTTGDVHAEARALAVKTGLATAVVAVIFLVWTLINTGNKPLAWVLCSLAAVALLVGIFFAYKDQEKFGFIATFLCIALAVWGLFAALFPNVLPSTTDPAFSLTAANASSTPLTLTIMTWVAVIFTPIVLAYQAWSYWVFRKRLSTKHIPATSHF